MQTTKHAVASPNHFDELACIVLPLSRSLLFARSLPSFNYVLQSAAPTFAKQVSPSLDQKKFTIVLRCSKSSGPKGEDRERGVTSLYAGRLSSSKVCALRARFPAVNEGTAVQAAPEQFADCISGHFCGTTLTTSHLCYQLLLIGKHVLPKRENEVYDLSFFNEVIKVLFHLSSEVAEDQGSHDAEEECSL